MADGSYKQIQDIVPGDKVLGAFDIINTVKEIDNDPLNDDPLWMINNEIITHAMHRFWVVDRGWCSLDPASFQALLDREKEGAQAEKGRDWLDGDQVPESEMPKQLTFGDRLAYGDGEVVVKSIDRVDFPNDTKLYELHLNNGSGSYTIYGGYKVTGTPDYSFDFQARIVK